MIIKDFSAMDSVSFNDWGERLLNDPLADIKCIEYWIYLYDRDIVKGGNPMLYRELKMAITYSEYVEEQCRLAELEDDTIFMKRF